MLHSVQCTVYLVKRSQVIQLELARIDSGSKNETFWIKAGHRWAVEVHQSLTVRRAEVPKTYGPIERAREKGVVDW